jgi:hypothetical protein
VEQQETLGDARPVLERQPSQVEQQETLGQRQLQPLGQPSQLQTLGVETLERQPSQLQTLELPSQLQTLGQQLPSQLQTLGQHHSQLQTLGQLSHLQTLGVQTLERQLEALEQPSLLRAGHLVSLAHHHHHHPGSGYHQPVSLEQQLLLPQCALRAQRQEAYQAARVSRRSDQLSDGTQP